MVGSPDTTEGDDMDTGGGAKFKKKYHVDTVMLNYPKKDSEAFWVSSSALQVSRVEYI